MKNLSKVFLGIGFAVWSFLFPVLVLACELSSTSLNGDPNLQAYYKFENVNDSSVNGYNLTNNNAVTFVTGTYGLASSFNGTNQYLSITDQANLDGFSEFTYCVWLKPTSWPAADNSFTADKFVTGNSNASWQFRYDTQGGGNKQYFTVVDSDGATADELEYSASIPTGAWNHYCRVWIASSKTFRWFTNGVLVSTQTGTNVDAMQNSTAGMQIGARNAVLLYNGLQDDMALFNRALTTTEIMELATTTCGGGGGGGTTTPFFFPTSTGFGVFLDNHLGDLIWIAASFLILALFASFVEVMLKLKAARGRI